MSVKHKESTLVMKRNFIPLWEQGYSVPRIAEIHHLAFGTVYRLLGEIASENGFESREMLLSHPHFSPHIRASISSKQKPPECEDLLKGIKAMSDAVEEILNHITKLLEESL